MPELSVIVCTHNPRPDYFARTLAALRAQTLPPEHWDLLIVDNASTADKAPRPDLSWHPQARVLHEPKLGLTQARLRGIRAAVGGLLVLVDDDNVLDPDYLAIACGVAHHMPFLGSWSGQCRPEFEEPPPEWTSRYWGNLVIREFDRDTWSNLPRLGETMPCGAGLCVRLPVAQHYLHLHETGRRSMPLDRVGHSLVSGGDNDLAACACDLGQGVGLIASLKLTHLIPPHRLTLDYLARLAESIQFSSLILDAERGFPVPGRGMAGRIADRLRLQRLRGPDREIMRAVFRGRAAAPRYIAGQAVYPPPAKPQPP
jgi:glycosyltransferase involved in cell wall biosynthesis